MQRNFSATLETLKSYMADPAIRDEDDEDSPPFHVDDDGMRDLRAHGFAPFEPTGNEKLDAVIRRASPRFVYGVPPQNQTNMQDVNDDDVITVPSIIGMPHREQFKSDADYRAILAHELVHWTKAEGMTPRPSGGITGLERMLGLMPPDYPREEMVAEIGAALLLDAVGEPPNLPERALYAKGWASAIDDDDDRAAAIDWASEKAQEAVDWLLGEQVAA